MNDNLTDITIVLDRSGSMQSVADDTKGGFDQFIEDQKKVSGDATLTLVQFDSEYEFVHKGVPIKEVPPLVFKPRGTTALLDAIGRAVTETGNRLLAMSENERPGKVIFVIITDGFENSSKEYNKPQINSMVTHQQDTYKWQFVYLGANQDAIATGTGLGISAQSSMSYAPTRRGTKRVYYAVSNAVMQCRNGANNVSFSDEDRKEQDELIAEI